MQAEPELFQQARQGQHRLPAPGEFLICLRLAHAADLMKGTRKSIGDIAAGCGYPNQLHFSRAFKKRYGIPPRE